MYANAVLLLTEFCSVNTTSGDLTLVADRDSLTVSCHISYFTASHWIPRPECLPNGIGQTEVIMETPANISYTNSFNATPYINDVVIECVAKFNSTGYEPDPGVATNAPRDLLLWKSKPLQVLCKRSLYVIIILLLYTQLPTTSLDRYNVTQNGTTHNKFIWVISDYTSPLGFYKVTFALWLWHCL